jgi:GT2 family glycosyltransferase
MTNTIGSDGVSEDGHKGLGRLRLGVSIVNYLSREATTSLLRELSVVAETIELEVVVVDNSATDCVSEAATLELECRSLSLPCQYLPSRNVGFAGGHNQGLRRLSERGVAATWLLNPDIRIDVRSNFHEVQGVLRRLEGVPRILATMVAHEGVVRPGLSRLDLRTTRTSPARSQDAGRTDSMITFADGCSFMLTKEAVDLVGGLNDGLFLFFEEADLMVRGAAEGVSLEILTGLVVSHEKGGTTGSGLSIWERSPVTIFHANRSCVLFYRQHYPELLVKCIAARGIQAFDLLVRLRYSRALAVVRGVRSGLGRSPFPAVG